MRVARNPRAPDRPHYKAGRAYDEAVAKGLDLPAPKAA